MAATVAGRRRLVGAAPIRVWGAIGAASVVLAIVVLAQWVAGGISTAGPGPDAFGGARLVLLHVLEWAQFAVFVVIAWMFVIIRLRRRRPLGFDGLFVLGSVMLNFWDPLDNYWTFSFQYNAHHLNVSSWGGYIPGWHSADPALWAVPIGFVFGAYTWAFFGASRAGCAILARRPGWRGWSLVFLASAAIAAVAELVYLHIGAFANIRTPAALTLGRGRPDGWPVYNPVFFGLTWTAMTWLRWSRDDSGLSAVERGAAALAVSPHVQTVLRLLAIFAFMEVAYITLYFLPWNLLAASAHPIAHVPSYFPTPPGLR
jgi:hypothetical protein